MHLAAAVSYTHLDVYKRQIPLLVIDLPASADAFAKGIINPLDGAFGVPVADIGPHGIVALVEGLDAIEVAVALPHREDRSPEGLEDQWEQGVLGCQGEFMLEFERGLDCLLIVFGIPDLLDDFQKHLHFLVADTVNTQLGGQSVKRDSHFKDGADFFVPDAASVVFHYGHQGVQGSLASVIGHIGSASWLDVYKRQR